MKKTGILGGGQLGRMLLQAAINYPVETFVLEKESDCPAAHLCHHFIQGDITNFDDVYQFGKKLDALTIEIENVNVEALEALAQEGVAIYPTPSTLRIIKNKILQKQFYQENSIPTSPFIVTENINDIHEHTHLLPAVHKIGTGGYDGRGVQIIQAKDDIHKGFNAPGVLEKLIPVQHEIALLVAVNNHLKTAIYPAVEMVFDPDLNVLNYQISPAGLSQELLWKAEAVALKVVQSLKSPGIFAVELLIDDASNVWVNETAPRVHNSGHHTIEGNYSSQFDMLWRIILDYPLGNTTTLLPSAMVNILGADHQVGVARYEGLEDILQLENAFVHIYGKKETKPGRKMGHITLVGKDKQELLHQINKIHQTVKVTT